MLTIALCDEIFGRFCKKAAYAVANFFYFSNPTKYRIKSLQTVSSSRFFRFVSADFLSPDIEDLLAAQGFSANSVPFCSFARELVKSPFALGRSLAAFFGYLYIQDPSSMLPPLALNPPRGAAVLDLCASPGGKTGILSQLVGSSGLVVANEPNPSRRATMQANFLRQNLTNVAICGYAGEKIPLAEENWQYILLDAPCSGWGTEKKNPQVKKVWTAEKATQLVLLQRRLLEKAARLLAPGGRLVYSTCTTNPRENEEQIFWAVKKLGLEAERLFPFSGFAFEKKSLVDGFLLVDGERCRAQGFFIACLHKPGGKISSEENKLKENSLPGSFVDWRELMPNLPDEYENTEGLVVRDNVYLVGKKALSLLGDLHWQGLRVGKMKKGIFSPLPRARCLIGDMSPKNRLVFENVEEIERILSGASFLCGKNGENQFGFLPFFWKNLPLGWLRVKGERCIWSGRD